MNDTLFTSLQTFRANLNASCLERESVIDGLLATLISQQNAFLLGEPGTGKSDLVRNLCKGISGANYFGYLLTPTTDPSEIFGPVAVTKLLNDEYIRDIKGYLPDAHIAFTDELFRGSSAILNSLLTLLNERTFNNGKEVIDTPIQSIVAATNSWPDEESLQAFADRFLFRPTVEFLKKSTSKRILDSWALGVERRPSVSVHLTLDQLTQLQTAARQIKVSEDFVDKYGEVWEMLSGRGITISDRRRVQILKFLRAWAIVQGDEELVPEHMHNSLVHIVYRTSDDKDIIQEILNQLIPTADKIFADAKRAASGIMTEYTTATHTQLRGNRIADLNNFVIQLRKYHKDMQTVRDKVVEVIDGNKYRMTIATRQTGVKLQKQLESHCETLTVAISDICK
jgi:MoxR-like ATPase